MPHLYHSYVAGRVRESGKVELGAEKWSLSPGTDASDVVRAHQRLLDDAALRARYSHAIFVVDNNVRNSYEFPDPKDAQREAVARQITSAQAALAQAKAAESAAKASAADVKAIKAQRESAEKRLAELQGQATALTPPAPAPKIPPAPKPASAQAPASPEAGATVDAQLAALSDDEVLRTAIELNLDVPAAANREQILALIKAATAQTPV